MKEVLDAKKTRDIACFFLYKYFSVKQFHPGLDAFNELIAFVEINSGIKLEIRPEIFPRISDMWKPIEKRKRR